MILRRGEMKYSMIKRVQMPLHAPLHSRERIPIPRGGLNVLDKRKIS